MQDATIVEVSWEVANKVGGIHTVLSSRSKYMVGMCDEYIAIGPLLGQQHNPDVFVSRDAPEHIQRAIQGAQERGVHCEYGTWDIPGNPQCILVSTTQHGFDTQGLKTYLYEHYGIDTANTSWGFDEPLQWSWGVGILLDHLCKQSHKEVIAQFHEWMAGMGLLYCHQHNLPIKTIFTTHATMLGRTISGATDQLLHRTLHEGNPIDRARQLGVLDKHTAEVACATHADIFSTVSDTTAKEATVLLGRAPDFVLYNGLDMRVFGSWELLHNKRGDVRERLEANAVHILGAPAFPHKKRLRVFYTSGRYEYKNKGMDVIVPALRKLNEYLLHTQSDVAVLMLFAVMSDPVEVDRGVLWRKSMLAQLLREATRCADQSESAFIHELLFSDDISSVRACVDEDLYHHMQTRVMRMHRSEHPPMSTHYLRRPELDPVLHALARNGMHNSPHDPVQTVIVPLMLDGFDGIFNERYYTIVSGCDLGIFPSLYEPWGYTPLESIALGVPTVTTDLSGFGQFIEGEGLDDASGVWVVDRSKQEFQATVDAVFEVMKQCCESDDDQWDALSEQAKQTSIRADWQTFIKRYEDMYRGERKNTHE